MNIVLFLSVFAALTIGYLILGLVASRSIKSTTDYFLAGRKLGLLPVTFTLIATQIGGGMLTGTSQEAYSVGFWGLLYTIGMCLGFVILGLGLARRLQSLKVATTAELFETRYKSPLLKKIASLLSVMTMSGILLGQIIASRTVLAGVGINNEWLFIGFWLFIIIYTVTGGLKAVVWTDLVQVVFILALFTGIFVYAQWIDPISFFSFAKLAENQALFSCSNLGGNAVVATLVMPALFSLIEQDLAQRFFASRSGVIAGASALLAAAALFVFALIPIYFGMQAKILGLVVPEGTSPLLPVLNYLTNDLITTLAVCGILAAITSTADSLLCAISSNLAQDFKISIGRLSRLRISQLITFIVGTLAVIISYFVPQNIIGILIESYSLSVVCLLVPLLACYFSKNNRKEAAFGAVLGGLIGILGLRIIPLAVSRELLALTLSLAGFMIGKMIAIKKPITQKFV